MIARQNALCGIQICCLSSGNATDIDNIHVHVHVQCMCFPLCICLHTVRSM